MSETTHYAVSASRDGFRRAGRTWARIPAVVPAAELDEAALAALMADRSITIVPCSADGPGMPAETGQAAPRAGVYALRAGVDALRAELIRAAIGELNPASKTCWTKDGRPEIAALKTASGLAAISAKERDAAWEDVSATA